MAPNPGRTPDQYAERIQRQHGPNRDRQDESACPHPDRAAPDDVVDALFAAVTPRTRAIFLSHITSGTAIRLPVEEVARRAREAGIVSVVDGAHAVGQIPVDLTALGVDCYASNFHKWLCAPKGSGFLYARPEAQQWLESPIVSWGWVEDRSDHFRPESQFVSRNQIQGTRDLAPFLAAPAAVQFQAERQWDAVRERCHALVLEARERIAAVTGQPHIVPAESDGGYRWFRQMAVAPLPPGIDSQELKRRLYDEDRIEIPVTAAGDIPLIRFSFQGYNTRDDLEALVAALERLLPVVNGRFSGACDRRRSQGAGRFAGDCGRCSGVARKCCSGAWWHRDRCSRCWHAAPG
mgnify:CR=1 FL=1